MALFIHGVPATHTLWRPIVERVAEERHCILPDLPGFGGSPAPHSLLTIADRAAEVLAAADRLGVEKFDLVGHSYGGAVALTLAASAPERIRSLALLTPLTPTPPPLARLTGRMRFMRVVSRLWRMAPGPLRRAFISSIWTRVNYGAAWQRERAREVAREADRPGMIETIGGAISNANFEAYERAIATLSQHKLPILLLSCGRDRVIPGTEQQKLLEHLTEAHHHHIDDGTHLPMWQYPDRVVTMIRELWERGEGGEARSGQ